MRILHVIGKLDRGGVETWLVQLLRHIDRKKYQMDFMVHTEDTGAYDAEVHALGARVIPCLRPSNPLPYAFRFWRILRGYGPYDVVHSHVHHFSGYVLALAALAGIPVRIAHSHNDTGSAQLPVSSFRRIYYAAMRSLIYYCATAGLTVSAEAGDDLFSWPWQGSSKWRLQHLGIDLSRFQDEVDRSTIRHELGIPAGAIVIGHVGRFSEQKNHSFMVEIARELIRIEPRAVFLMVGDGALRPSIEQKVASYSLKSHFLFTGVRSDVPRLMKGAMDILVFPSLYEGLPITLLETQAACLKCVASDVITPEVAVIKGLVIRESLDSSPLHWAKRLLQEATQPARVPFLTICSELASRSVETSSEQLLPLYANFS
jgi:glycosyltransferase involved in cell wall biosynthesis